PILNKDDLGLIGSAICSRAQSIQVLADQLHDIDIGFLVPAPDIVSLTDLTSLQDAPDRAAMITDKQPVTNLLAITIDRQRFPSQRIDDHKRNQLLRKMIWPIIIGTIGGQGR